MSESLGIDYETEPSKNLVPVSNDTELSSFDETSATNYEDLNEIIHKTKNFGMSLLESADTYEPRARPRMYEVANQLLGTSLQAIKAKHAYEGKMRDHLKKTPEAGDKNTQINNFFGTREEMLKMIKQMKEEN